MAGETDQPRTSLAVWDIASPAVAGERFTLKAGVKSSSGSRLGGGRIAICDANGAVIGEGRLGDAPWPDTEALYWTELSLPAPGTTDRATLSARFDGTALQPPHASATLQFQIAVVPPPAHTLTVTVGVAETGAPLAGAVLRLGPYRATTDRAGQATLGVAKGQYQLHVWKVGHDTPMTAVDMTNDTSIRIAAVVVPEENVDRAWKG